MATTLGRLDPLVKWPHEVTWLIKSDISPSLRGLWLPKLTRWMFILKGKGPPSIESFDALITLPSYHMTDAKRYISTSAGPMATKLDRVVGSIIYAGRLSIKSHNLLITWSYKVIWQTKNVINLLSRNLSLSNLTEGWLMIKQISPCRIVTGNSMYLFFFQKKKETFCTRDFLKSEF